MSVSNDDLCLPCISLVGAGRQVVPHPDLRKVQNATDAQLFHCLACDARWDVRKLGWGRLKL
jgi:hypothetical protein